MTTPVPGPPASVLAAIVRADPAHPYSAADPTQRRAATFTADPNLPLLPSMTTDVVWMPLYAVLDANGTWTGFVSTEGLPGAVAASRYVGATTAGSPTAGTFAVGDWVIDQTGVLWICNGAGTPGTWVGVSGGTGFTNPMNHLGDMMYGSTSGVPVRLAGNSTSATQFLASTGSGTAAAAPAWQAITLASLGTTGTASLGQVPMATSPSAVKWATHPVDWVNAATEYGADPTGAADSTTAIQNALNAVPSGGVVYLPAGTYVTSAPLAFPSVPMTLAGDTGAMQSGGGSPGVGTIIKPAGAFAQGGATVNAVIIGGNAARQSVQDLWINGASASTVADLEGIDFSTANSGQSIYRVGVNNMPSWGVYASGFLGWYADTLIIQACGTNVSTQHLAGSSAGGYYAGSTDSYHHNVHAQNNTGYGIVIRGGDHRLVACRADGSTLHGFDLSCFNGGGGLGLGAVLAGCATESNKQEGCYMSGGGHNTYGPYQLVGCQFTGDGQGGTYGAMNCNGRVVVSVTDVEVSGNGTYPAYALVTSQNAGTHAVPDLVEVNGGTWQAGTGFIDDAGPATCLTVSPATMGVLGAINGTSGTTALIPVRSPVVISSPGFAVGTASQLSDITRDYMVYLTIGTAGTGMTLAIGPTSTPAYTIHSSSTPTTAMQFSVRLPAGWYLEVAGTSTTIANQVAISC